MKQTHAKDKTTRHMMRLKITKDMMHDTTQHDT